jgi:hypothetical protein
MVEPRLLLLRLWPGQTPFRAVVREFEPERSLHFDDARALVDFVLAPLTTVSAPAPASDPPARTRVAKWRTAK